MGGWTHHGHSLDFPELTRLGAFSFCVPKKFSLIPTSHLAQYELTLKRSDWTQKLIQSGLYRMVSEPCSLSLVGPWPQRWLRLVELVVMCISAWGSAESWIPEDRIILLSFLHMGLFFPCVEKGNFAVMIKDLKADRLFQIILAQHNRQGSRREAGVWEPGRENKDAVLLALKMMQRATRWAMRVASRSWRREGNGGKGIVPLYWSPVAAITEYHRLVA